MPDTNKLSRALPPDERLRDVLRLLAYGLEWRDWAAVREARERLENARLAALKEG